MLQIRVIKPSTIYGPTLHVGLVDSDLSTWETNPFAGMTQPLTPEFVASLEDAAAKARIALNEWQAKRGEAA